MKIRKVWNQCNISTLLIFPLFNNLVKDVKTKKRPYLNIPLYLLASEYGLEKAYIFSKNDYSVKYLTVVFSKKVLENLKLTNSSYYSFNERIISSKYFHSVEEVEDLLVYKLKIDDKWKKDIDLIINGKYSNVSNEYKMKLKITQKYIPSWNNTLGGYICKENLPYSIVSKQHHLKVIMEDAVGITIGKNSEYYLPFSYENEIFDK